MTLPEFGVKRPVATTVVFAAMVILGLFSLAFIQLDLMPAMDIPIIGTITTYKGAGPQEIEGRITRNGDLVAEIQMMFAHLDQSRAPLELGEENFVFTEDFIRMLRMRQLNHLEPPSAEHGS